MKSISLTTSRRNAMFAEAFKIFSGALLLCFASFVKIPLFFTPVPVTLQTFVVFLIGGWMSPAAAAASVMLYISAGLFGAPFFANAGWGLAYLLGPTGGYLVGFLTAAALISVLKNICPKFLAMVAGIAVIYLCGALWLKVGFAMTPRQIFSFGILPFIVPDLMKALLASLISGRLSRR